MKQQNNNIIKNTAEIFLGDIKRIAENKIILKNENIIDLEQKHSIRKWIKQNTLLDQISSRRKYVELSMQVDIQIRQQIQKMQQEEIRQKFKKLEKRHTDFMKQIRNRRITQN